MIAAFLLAATLARPPAGVAPPPRIDHTCATDVSGALTRWLRTQHNVTVPRGYCFLINSGLKLHDVNGLEVWGGTYKALTQADQPAWWFVGGSNITLRAMTIIGGNTKGRYLPKAAFAAAIRSDGVSGLVVRGSTIDYPYGDGVELNALRGAQDDSSQILAATTNALVHNVSIAKAGRQGVTFASVNGATISHLTEHNPALNAFDVEADQWNEGSKNVAISDCSVTANGLRRPGFVSNGGAGAGSFTGGISVSSCSTAGTLSGSPILVLAPTLSKSARGPFTFTDDQIQCGASVSVSCIQLRAATVSVVGGSLTFRSKLSSLYSATKGSTLQLASVAATGYGKVGYHDSSSTVTVTGSGS